MGTNPTGLTKETGWQIGVRRTLPVSKERLWELLVSPRGIALWLGDVQDLKMEKGAVYHMKDGTKGEVRVYQPNSHWRITRHPPDAGYPGPSTIQVRVLDAKGKAVIAFHEEQLPSQTERQSRKTFYLEVIDRIRGLIADKSTATSEVH
jgi:uncharacterized protein YndB with AHSA1/START domain